MIIIPKSLVRNFKKVLEKENPDTAAAALVHSSCKYHSHSGIRQGSCLSAYEPAQLQQKWFLSKFADPQNDPTKSHRCELEVRNLAEFLFSPKPLSCQACLFAAFLTAGSISMTKTSLTCTWYAFRDLLRIYWSFDPLLMPMMPKRLRKRSGKPRKHHVKMKNSSCFEN